MKHVILTRFNINAFPQRGLPSDSWMEHRMELFEKVCFPSIESQTEQGFEWLIFLHPATDRKIIRRLRVLQDRRFFELCFAREIDQKYFGAVAAAYRTRDSDPIITTRLDNDDGLHSEYVRKVQQSLGAAECPIWVNCDHGLRLNEKGIFRKTHYSNAFLSRIEWSEKITTALTPKHSFVKVTEKVFHDRGFRGWLQVVHGKNVANKMRANAIPGSFA